MLGDRKMKKKIGLDISTEGKNIYRTVYSTVVGGMIVSPTIEYTVL